LKIIGKTREYKYIQDGFLCSYLPLPGLTWITNKLLRPLELFYEPGRLDDTPPQTIDMKRKAADSGAAASNGNGKKRATNAGATQDRFRQGLFKPATIQGYASEYAKSSPYKHAVVSDLINDDLLRSVRSEIVNNIHFTPKETDIYKIHQSGDLANLDGLPAAALEKLPSMLKLRDAMYGKDFREWVSSVSGAGALSGKKTDMAVNLYVPGCHLLCHDDVIGSRRVSYILYLTDPDKPWKAEWGGALRLYPTDEVSGDDGKTFKLPQSGWTKVIPPAWNQLSFFAVQPGESFHDVEEVYKGASQGENDGGRFRMAISGWFHIPQEGEEGFEPGLEERLAEKSSLQQLQGKADEFDEPQQEWISPKSQADTEEETDDDDDVELTPEDLQFLIKYMTPNYLTPDTVEELNELFTEESILQLSNFLSEKFSASLKAWFQENPEHSLSFATSRPPHKHRYQYLKSQPGNITADSPLRQVLDELLPSLAFRKWLALVTGLTLKRSSVIARRFRKGLDYQLAQGYEGEDPQLEYTLCITPTSGWGGEQDFPEEETKGNGKKAESEDEDNVGGYELYMAGDDPDDEEEGSDDGVTIPANVQSHTGAGQRRPAKRKKADPAVYQAAGDDEDDGILFSNAASWNTMSFVLRDRGTLKFVKYVSQSAPGDRYDITGCVEVEPEDDEDDEEDEEEVEAEAESNRK
jgi:Rps23 Pro-64 3,4-dihydroxylase Tpa1-like proline 4-hydroxylase